MSRDVWKYDDRNEKEKRKFFTTNVFTLFTQGRRNVIILYLLRGNYIITRMYSSIQCRNRWYLVFAFPRVIPPTSLARLLLRLLTNDIVTARSSSCIVCNTYIEQSSYRATVYENRYRYNFAEFIFIFRYICMFDTFVAKYSAQKRILSTLSISRYSLLVTRYWHVSWFSGYREKILRETLVAFKDPTCRNYTDSLFKIPNRSFDRFLQRVHFRRNYLRVITNLFQKQSAAIATR